MKRKQLLTKTFLIAAMLFVGMSAWADSKLTFYSNDFSAANSLDLIGVLDGTTYQTLELATEDGRGNYVRQTTQDRARDMYMNLTSLLSKSFADYTDYIVEFDAAFRSGTTNRTAGNKLYLSSTGSTNIFYMATPSDQVYGGDLVFTVAGAAEGKEITLTALTWYHFKFDITTTQVTYTVTKASDNSAVTNGTGTLSITDSRIKQIYFGTARNTGQSRLDNVDIYTMISGDVANEPTVTETAVLDENRQYTITFSDGETLHYTLPGGTEQTTSTSPLVVTVQEAGTLSAYTTKGSATSSTVNTTVTHGAIPLNNPTYTLNSISEGYGKTYTINYNVNGVELIPAATMSYVFTPAGGSAEAPVNIASGGKINATAAGTYVITASATGYTSSTLTITNNQAYTKTKSYDFSSLTADDLDLTTPKWTGPASYSYQTSSSSTLFTSDSYTVVSDYASNSAIDGVNLNSAAVLMIGYGLHPNGNNGGFSLAGLNEDDLVLWTYYDYSTQTEAIKSYNSKFTGNGNHYRYLINKAEVYSPLNSVSATISASGYTSLSSAYALDFSEVEGLTAFVVKEATSNGVTLSSVSEAPAATGLILKGEAGETYNIPVVAFATEPAVNLLSAAVTATVVDDGSVYILKGGKFCLLNGAETEAARTIPAGKAYLPKNKVTTGKVDLAVTFEEEAVTGIESVQDFKGSKVQGFYDLQGRRVSQPTKGMYIMDGKKVVVK